MKQMLFAEKVPGIIVEKFFTK